MKMWLICIIILFDLLPEGSRCNCRCKIKSLTFMDIMNIYDNVLSLDVSPLH